MAKIRFTKRALEALPPAPAGKRVFYYSDETKGLALQVTDKGAKTFYLYRKLAGKPERIHLGIFPETSLDQATRKADELNGLIATGADPLAAAGPRRGEWTLADLWGWYLERHAKPSKKTWKWDEYGWKNHVSTLGGVRLSALTRKDVRAWHQQVGAETGPSAANKALYLLRGMLNLAGDHEIFDGANAAEGIKPFREDSRERRLSTDELGRLLAAIDADHDQDAKDWLLLALYTGARKGNILAMRWDEVDTQRAAWRIPVAKNGDPLVLPLEPLELAILARRRGAIKGPWVFPGRADSETGHLVDGRKPWERIRDRAGLVDFHVHDLRRTHGSLMADTGASLPIIGRALGHKDSDSTAIYARLDLGPVREAKRAALAALEEARKQN